MRVLNILILLVLAAVILGGGGFVFSVRHFSWNYVCVKYGLVEKADLDSAFYQSMLLDRDRDSLVEGLTVEQLRKRFGLLRRGDSVSDYQRPYERFETFDEHVWVGDGPWMIRLKDGKGVELALVKG